MMENDFNMSIRKFLKEVGVSSQQAIEEAIRDAGVQGPLTAKMVLTIDGVDLEHIVTGTISRAD